MAVEIIETLYVQALQNRFCDVIIKVHGRIFGAHRGVLVQATPYFEKMFSGHFMESQEGEISFTELTDSVELFEAILKYMYLHKFDISAYDTEEVLNVSSLLLLKDLVDECHQCLLEELTVDNALYTWALSYMYSLTQLESVCKALVKCHFGDTLQHGHALKLPVGLLCYFIKEGMLDNQSLPKKLRFLQRWLQESTRKCLWRDKPTDLSLIARISNELEDCYPELVKALRPTDTFLMRSFPIEYETASPVDALLQVACLRNSDKTDPSFRVCVGDISQGLWYESSHINVSDTKLDNSPMHSYMGFVSRFIVLRKEKDDELLALDIVNNTSTTILTPLYSFKESHHLFSLAGRVCCVVSMMDWAVPLAGENSGVTFIAEDSHSHKREGNGEGRSANHRSIKFAESASNASGDDAHLGHSSTESLINKVPSQKNNGPVDLSFKSNARMKHCLFHLQVTCECENAPITSHSKIASGEDCTTCPLTWSYSCEIDIELTKSSMVLSNYQSVEIDGKHWIMASSVEKQMNNVNDEEVTQDLPGHTQGPFLFCVKQSDANPGNFAVDVLPSAPEKRMKTSRQVNWENIELITVEGCPGLRSIKKCHCKYSIYFDTKDWRWKWVSYRRSYNVAAIKQPESHPEPVKLPIERKSSSGYAKLSTSVINDPHIFSCTNYPMINQLWRYDTHINKWLELPSSPFTLNMSSWRRVKLPRSALAYLHPACGGSISPVSEEKVTFADFKIVTLDGV